MRKCYLGTKSCLMILVFPITYPQLSLIFEQPHDNFVFFSATYQIWMSLTGSSNRLKPINCDSATGILTLHQAFQCDLHPNNFCACFEKYHSLLEWGQTLKNQIQTPRLRHMYNNPTLGYQRIKSIAAVNFRWQILSAHWGPKQYASCGN